jgi:hypothetical protein
MDIERMGWVFIAELLAGLSVSVTIILIGFAFERRDAPFFDRARARLFNILYLFPASLLQHLLTPLAAAAVMVEQALLAGTPD